MNGAQSLIRTLVNSGVEICFTNPGTSEMHFVAALDEVDGMRCVLCLFEGVASGAADGYARMAGRPASTLLHLGPGLGNALANVHNARRGLSPLINIVGDHATYHLQYNTPLTSDITTLAAPVSDWVHTCAAPADIPGDAARAVQAAGRNRVATLVLPADLSWSEAAAAATTAEPLPPLGRVGPKPIAAAAAALKSGEPCMVMIGSVHVTAEHARLLSQLAAATGARVGTDTFPPRQTRGAGTGKLERLGYLAELAIDSIKDVRHLILLGASPPAAFFAYPNVPSEIAAPGCNVQQLATPEDDIAACLGSLLDAVGGAGAAPDLHELERPPLASGPLDVNAVGLAVAHYLPEDAVVVDEGATSSVEVTAHTRTAPRHDWLTLTGGAIGFGLPAAVGAALACPGRKVVCLEGDGSAMYTISALWTMAREGLDVTVVMFNNRKYSILELEFARTGARGGVPGPKAASMLDIGSPQIDFAALAEGMGVRASRADTAEAFNSAFAAAMAQPGPHLIDARVPTAWS